MAVERNVVVVMILDFSGSKNCLLFQLLTRQHSCTSQNVLACKKLLKGGGGESIEEWIS